MHPAYAGFLPAVTAAVGPELTEFAGLPGAPARISQVAAVYQQEPGNGINVSAHVSGASEFIVPEPLPGQPGGTSAQFAANLAEGLGLQLASHVILGGAGRAAGAAPEPGRARGHRGLGQVPALRRKPRPGPAVRPAAAGAR